MTKYTYQKFLLNRDYESIDLQSHVLTVTNDKIFLQGYNSISLSTLDCTVDLEEDLGIIAGTFDHAKPVMLINDRSFIDNPILVDYGEATLKAYIHWFNEQGLECYWGTPPFTVTEVIN